MKKQHRPPAGLTREERQELVDVLRKNFLYQQPMALHRVEKPGDTVPEGTEPDYVGLRMIPGHWQRMMELLNKAGGWTMPDPDAMERVVQ